MSEQFYTIPTATGKAKIANSIVLGTKINLTTMKVGDSNGSYYDPSESQTDLVHTVYSCNVTSVEIDETNSNWINVICAIPSDVGDFYIREAGIFDYGGNLIAIGKYPETYKPVAADGSTKELYIKMTFQVTNASSVELKIDPTVILATKSDISILTNSIAQINSSLSDKANLRKGTLYNNAITAIESDISEEALEQARMAITNGSIKIAFFGDSITQGYDQTNPKDAYAERFITALKSKYPDVTINYTNFAIAGRALSNAVSNTYNNYSGVVLPWVTDTNKIWRDYVKDYRPDLLIVAFGMNDSNGAKSTKAENDKYFADNLNSLNSFINTWTKIPSIVLVSNFLCTTDIASIQPEIPGFAQDQMVTQATARTIRYFAKNNNMCLADANRLYLLLRDGNDDVLRASTKETNWDGLATSEWSGDKTNFTLNGSTLTPDGSAGKYLNRLRNIYEGAIECDFIPQDVGANGVLWVGYRRDTDLGYLLWNIVPSSANNVADGQVVLYKATSIGTTKIYMSGGLIINESTSYHLRIEFTGSTHNVFINNTMVGSFTTYYCMHDGFVTIGSSGKTPILQNLSIQYNDMLYDSPMFSQAELLGTLPYLDTSTSGNGINHPTGLGHALIYFNAFHGIISKVGMNKSIYCALKLTMDTAISNNSETIVAFDTISEDKLGLETNNTTITIVKKGIYLINAYANWGYSNTESDVFIMKVNTTQQVYYNTARSIGNATVQAGNNQSTSYIAKLNVGDVVRLYVERRSTNTVDLQNAGLSVLSID